MIEFIWDNKFKRNYKKLTKYDSSLKSLVYTKLEKFSQEPFDPSLKTHKLSGNLNHYWSLSITYDIRIIFRFINKNSVLLIDIGKHDNVY